MFDAKTLGYLFVFVFLLNLLRNRSQLRLSSVPGPFLASLSDFYRFVYVWKDDISDHSLRLHEKYGPLVRMGPKYISASSSESINAIYRQGTGFQKTDTYSLLQPIHNGEDLHNLFSTQDKKLHATIKRNIGSLFSEKGIRVFEASIDRTISSLLQQWNSRTKSGKAIVDAGAWMQYWAFDTIGEINFSQELGFLSQGKDVQNLCAENHHNMMYFGLMGQIPYIEKWWSNFKRYTADAKHNPLFQFVLDRLEEREIKPSSDQDLLSSFIGVHKRRPDHFARRDVIAAAYISLVTAHDVLAITLRAILYYLAKHPDKRQKMRAEIWHADKVEQLSKLAKYQEIENLEYVNAVIIEALRLHPSTGLMFERYVPEGGVDLHGRHIPAGVTIGVNAWVWNRNRPVFGNDSNEFRPERWIEASNEKSKEMKRWLFTFSAGSRACIGKHLAIMEISKVIVELYRNFDIELQDPDQEWHVDGNWLTAQRNMDMIITNTSTFTA